MKSTSHKQTESQKPLQARKRQRRKGAPLPIAEFLGAAVLLGWTFGSVFTLFAAYIAIGVEPPIPEEYGQNSDAFGWVYWSSGFALIIAIVLIILGIQKLIEYRRYQRGDLHAIQQFG